MRNWVPIGITLLLNAQQVLGQNNDNSDQSSSVIPALKVIGIGLGVLFTSICLCRLTQRRCSAAIQAGAPSENIAAGQEMQAVNESTALLSRSTSSALWRKCCPDTTGSACGDLKRSAAEAVIIPLAFCSEGN